MIELRPFNLAVIFSDSACFDNAFSDFLATQLSFLL